MFDLKPLSDPELLTIAGLLAALLSFAQAKNTLLPAEITLSNLGEAVVVELTERNRLEDVSKTRVLVIAGGQITEVSGEDAPSLNKDSLS